MKRNLSIALAGALAVGATVAAITNRPTASRLKTVMEDAATRVLGGASVPVALNQAGAAIGMDCDEWCELTEPHREVQSHEWAFIAISNGTPVPQAVADDPDRLLGVCGGGVCTYSPGSCSNCSVDYTYSASPLVAGWRVYAVRAPRYTLTGWQRAAAGNPDIHWWRYGSLAVAACLELLTPVQCLQLFEPIAAFRLPTGTLCTRGYVLGTSTQCAYAPVVSDPDGTCIYPFVTDRGAASWVDWCETDLTDEELEDE